jgi:hypothetical protein
VVRLRQGIRAVRLRDGPLGRLQDRGRAGVGDQRPQGAPPAAGPQLGEPVDQRGEMAVEQARRDAGQRVEPVPGPRLPVADGQRFGHPARREPQRDVRGAQVGRATAADQRPETGGRDHGRVRLQQQRDRHPPALSAEPLAEGVDPLLQSPRSRLEQHRRLDPAVAGQAGLDGLGLGERWGSGSHGGVS